MHDEKTYLPCFLHHRFRRKKIRIATAAMTAKLATATMTPIVSESTKIFKLTSFSDLNVRFFLFPSFRLDMAQGYSHVLMFIQSTTNSLSINDLFVRDV